MLRLVRLALATTGALLLHGAAFAKSIPVFDEVPSIEQLRSIMIPEFHQGSSRSIVIQRPDSGASSVQQASTQAAHTKPPKANTQVLAAHRDPATESGIVAFRVNFAFNSAQLPDTARPMIDLMAQLMKEAPDITVRVEGHTDATGSAHYNETLSERRALSVGVYLVEQGVEASRLTLIGKGMAEPLTSNRYDPANRRVQFVRVS